MPLVYNKDIFLCIKKDYLGQAADLEPSKKNAEGMKEKMRKKERKRERKK